ncbi:MAG: protein translocase subunit SecF [Gemmatimonadetes bacterium]|nr:MAG: protein translocase subunit SecF [Gemmatimonadota bacterium]
MEIFTNTNVDFIGKRKVAFIVSLVIISLGIISLIVHGGPRLSIDFEGGLQLQFRFEKPVDIAEIRRILAETGHPSAEIQMFGAETEVLIRIKGTEGTTETEEGKNPLVHEIQEAFAEAFPDNPAIIDRQEQVGPKVGQELKGQALLAILYSMIGIILYIWWRFEFKFGAAAVIALFHDVVITIGVFSLIDHEISLTIIAALLTIVGYSLNDTIVVFDRIRENLRNMRRKEYSEIINASINQTLSRTLLTSGTTFLVVLSLIILGGSVIQDFGIALLVGIVVGTYSSIFVASPMLVEWQARQEANQKAKVRTNVKRKKK